MKNIADDDEGGEDEMEEVEEEIEEHNDEDLPDFVNPVESSPEPCDKKL